MNTDGSEPAAPRDIPRAQDELFGQPGGAIGKYRRLVVGRAGLAALIKYEAVVLLSQAVPGALGLALRKWCYRWLLGRCGRNVVFGQNVVLRHPHKISIGDDVVVDDNCLLDAKGADNDGITIGSGVFIGRNTILSCKNGAMTIGDRANIGFNCEIFSASQVVVGPGTLIAAYVYLAGGDHEVVERGLPVAAQARRSAGIRVGEGCWIGAGAIVLDGVDIGDRAIIGANAVVRASVPAGTTAVGVPARLVGSPVPP